MSAPALGQLAEADAAHRAARAAVWEALRAAEAARLAHLSYHRAALAQGFTERDLLAAELVSPYAPITMIRPETRAT